MDKDSVRKRKFIPESVKKSLRNNSREIRLNGIDQTAETGFSSLKLVWNGRINFLDGIFNSDKRDQVLEMLEFETLQL